MTWLIKVISISFRAATGPGAFIKRGGLVALNVVICNFSFNLLDRNILRLLQLELCKHSLCSARGQSQRCSRTLLVCHMRNLLRRKRMRRLLEYFTLPREFLPLLLFRGSLQEILVVPQ